MAHSRRYDRFLKKGALKWGCHDPGEAARPHKIVKVYKGNDCSIRLFIFEEQYGYCLDIRLKYRWSLYGPFLGFSDPYSTRRLALEAAIDNVIQEAGTHGGPEKHGVMKWARSLLQEQLALF